MAILSSSPNDVTLKFHDVFLTYDQLPEPPADDWLIDGLIQAQSLVVLYGPPGRGKTFLAINAALCVATGTPCLGKSVKQGTVFFVAAEDGARTKRRVDGWLQDRGLTPPANAFYSLAAPNLFDPQIVAKFCDNVQKASDKTGAPGLIVIDNLARCMAALGASDSETGVTGQIMARIDDIKAKTGAAVLLLHHTNKQDEVERGSTTIRATADCMIMADGTTMKCTKQRSEEAFAPLGYTLRRIVFPDGKTTCVPIAEANTVKARTTTQQLILDALKDSPAGKKFSDLLRDTELKKSTFADALHVLREQHTISFSDGLYFLSKPSLTNEVGRSVEPPKGGSPTDLPSVVVSVKN